MKNRNGHTPADLADMSGHSECAKSLKAIAVKRPCISPTPAEPYASIASPTLTNGHSVQHNGHHQNGFGNVGQPQYNGFSNGHCDVVMEDDDAELQPCNLIFTNGSMEHVNNEHEHIMELHHSDMDHNQNGFQGCHNGVDQHNHHEGSKNQFFPSMVSHQVNSAPACENHIGGDVLKFRTPHGPGNKHFV